MPVLKRLRISNSVADATFAQHELRNLRGKFVQRVIFETNEAFSADADNFKVAAGTISKESFPDVKDAGVEFLDRINLKTSGFTHTRFQYDLYNLEITKSKSFFLYLHNLMGATIDYAWVVLYTDKELDIILS
jgi:hypothetical protein